MDDSEIEAWLRQSKPIGLTLDALEWVDRAIKFVLAKCARGVSRALSDTATSALTVLDTLAVVLAKGIKLAEHISQWVLYLMRKILGLLGYGHIVEAADLSESFIRHTLMALQQRVHLMAQVALDRALVQGRGVPN